MGQVFNAHRASEGDEIQVVLGSFGQYTVRPEERHDHQLASTLITNHKLLQSNVWNELH